MPLALVLGVGVGGLCGAINGCLIAGLRVVPFIVTLGSYTVYRGLAKWLASSTTVYVPAETKPWWFRPDPGDRAGAALAAGGAGVWVLLVLSVVVAVVLRYSLLGRYAYAIGSNEATARLCGINVPGIKVVVYAPGRPGDRSGRRPPIRLSRRDRRPDNGRGHSSSR